MEKKKRGVSLFWVVLVMILLVLGLIFNVFLFGSSTLTGKVTGTTSTTLTQAGAAGILIRDGALGYGSGYYNASCPTTVNNYATLDSNLTYGDGSGSSVNSKPSPYCWINTTAVLTGNGDGKDWHTIENNGSVMVNVSAIANQHAEDWLCGGNCPFTTTARAEYLSYNNETGACVSGGLTSGYEVGITSSTNVTVGICDKLDYVDASDSVNIYVNTSVPKDATSGAKTLTITYEALAL